MWLQMDRVNECRTERMKSIYLNAMGVSGVQAR